MPQQAELKSNKKVLLSAGYATKNENALKELTGTFEPRTGDSWNIWPRFWNLPKKFSASNRIEININFSQQANLCKCFTRKHDAIA
jgi:hypothetical protein